MERETLASNIIHDDAHNVFMAYPRYTSLREDKMQLVASGTMRHPTQQIHFIVKGIIRIQG